jgi:hypothetical protein
MAAIICLVLVAVGVGLIVLGAWMTLEEWKRARTGEIKARKDALGDSLKGLAKLVEALKYYPTGQRLIVFGIVVLIIAGLIGGFAGL